MSTGAGSKPERANNQSISYPDCKNAKKISQIFVHFGRIA